MFIHGFHVGFPFVLYGYVIDRGSVSYTVSVVVVKARVFQRPFYVGVPRRVRYFLVRTYRSRGVDFVRANVVCVFSISGARDCLFPLLNGVGYEVHVR